jgi:hypothetical protein
MLFQSRNIDPEHFEHARGVLNEHRRSQEAEVKTPGYDVLSFLADKLEGSNCFACQTAQSPTTSRRNHCAGPAAVRDGWFPHPDDVRAVSCGLRV